MINYTRIANAIDFYSNEGYAYVDLPWMIPEKYVEITLPHEHCAQTICPPILEEKNQHEVLVGSAEQAFLQYIDENDITSKDLHLMAVTPCFRSEHHLDEITRPYFMKLELCIVNPSHVEDRLYEIKDSALAFFIAQGLPAHIVHLKNNYDIVVNVGDKEIELGSYGYRRYFGLRWIYGTGIAEPRTSLCIDKLMV